MSIEASSRTLMAKTTPLPNVAGKSAGADVAAAFAGAQAAVNQLAKEAGVEPGGLDMLGDVDLHVSVELGRTEMLVEDILRLSEGSVEELDKLAGDPVDVYVNQRLVARGEVLVLNDNFCIRISEIVDNLAEQAGEAAAEAAA